MDEWRAGSWFPNTGWGEIPVGGTLDICAENFHLCQWGDNWLGSHEWWPRRRNDRHTEKYRKEQMSWRKMKIQSYKYEIN